jgi:hypothetical protein
VAAPERSVVWAESWDRVADCASGACRDLGACAVGGEADALARAEVEALRRGYGAGFAAVTDREGRRVAVPGVRAPWAAGDPGDAPPDLN